MSLPIFASHSKTYATVAVDINLLTDGNAQLPAGVRASGPTAACKRLIIRGAGVLHIQYANGSQDTMTVLAGEIIDGEITKILVDTSTATNITAYWGT